MAVDCCCFVSLTLGIISTVGQGDHLCDEPVSPPLCGGNGSSESLNDPRFDQYEAEPCFFTRYIQTTHHHDSSCLMSCSTIHTPSQLLPCIHTQDDANGENTSTSVQPYPLNIYMIGLFTL
ncbi:hypothetical protein B0T17DRAFT_515902 [Bombardia bombarda]|uniref:Uncharacterized protein n=1 Tax=Bombardia bombarda TaxID=252184 RepID=A0AA39XJR4_9PEZI|nr:hypothetical protein B0T17DRAFT_515902 [Bombardia bombarda]